MKARGSGIAPLRTRWAQNCRDRSNSVLTSAPWRCRRCRPGAAACSSARNWRRGRCLHCSRPRSFPGAQSSSVSKMVMVSEGSSSLSKVPSVALMMPAPIRTTSGVPDGWRAWRWPPSCQGCGVATGLEQDVGAGREDHIGAAPGLIVDQLPAVAGAGRVFRQQDVAGTDGEVFAAARLEFERAAERDDELAGRRVVPFKCAAGLGFAERDAGRWRRRR